MTKNYQMEGVYETPFNTEELQPYEYQLQHFDLICGHIITENHILRIVAVISAAAFFLSIGINLYAISLPKNIPVLVTMNDFGQASYIGEVTRKNYQNFVVPEIAIQYQVKDFVNLYYTLSSDKQIMKKSFAKVYHILTATTANKYSTLVREEKPFDDFGTKTREVFFQTEPLQLSKETYQVDFLVTERLLTGQITNKTVFRAVISIKTMQPSSEDLNDNPLGIYITAFDFKKINELPIENK